MPARDFVFALEELLVSGSVDARKAAGDEDVSRAGAGQCGQQKWLFPQHGGWQCGFATQAQAQMCRAFCAGKCSAGRAGLPTGTIREQIGAGGCFFQREMGGEEAEIFVQKERSEEVFILNMSRLCIMKRQLKPGIEASRIRDQVDGMRMPGRENLKSTANIPLKCAAGGFASGAGEGGAQCDGEEKTLKPQKRVKGLRAEFLPGWPPGKRNSSAQCSSGKYIQKW